MRKEVHYIAFDGRMFLSEEACLKYESESVLLSPEHIVYYTNDGARIDDPCEYTLLDSNHFIANSLEGLNAYTSYCMAHGIAAPDLPQYASFEDLPLHLHFTGGKWVCYEDEIIRLKKEIERGYLDKISENKSEHHDFVMEQFI